MQPGAVPSASTRSMCSCADCRRACLCWIAIFTSLGMNLHWHGQRRLGGDWRPLQRTRLTPSMEPPLAPRYEAGEMSLAHFPVWLSCLRRHPPSTRFSFKRSNTALGHACWTAVSPALFCATEHTYLAPAGPAAGRGQRLRRLGPQLEHVEPDHAPAPGHVGRLGARHAPARGRRSQQRRRRR